MPTMKILSVCITVVALIALALGGWFFAQNRALMMKNSLLEQGIKYRYQRTEASTPLAVASEFATTSTLRAYLDVLGEIRKGYLSPQTPNADFTALGAAVAATRDTELMRIWNAARDELSRLPGGSWNPEAVGNVVTLALARIAELVGAAAAVAPQGASAPTPTPAPLPIVPTVRNAPAPAPKPTSAPKPPAVIAPTPVAQGVRDAMVQYLCDPAKPTCPNSELMAELGGLYPRTVQVSTDGRYYKCVNLNETYYDQNRRRLSGDCPTASDLSLMQEQVREYCEVTWPSYVANGTASGSCPLEGQTPQMPAFCQNTLPTITFGAPYECPVRPALSPATSNP